VALDLDLEAFHQPPGSRWVDIKVLIDQGVPALPRTVLLRPNWDIGVPPGGHWQTRIRVTIETIHPTPAKRRDGWALLKLFGTVQRPDGGMIVATRIPVFLDNGFPNSGSTAKPWGGAAGWFIGPEGSHQYPTARLWQPTESALYGPIPSGWHPRLGVESTHTPLSRMRVCIDPHFHDLSRDVEGDPGQVVYDGSPLGTLTPRIDAASLSPGTHRLFVQAIETHFPTGASAGAAVFSFEV
jgi:hypothetical protein